MRLAIFKDGASLYLPVSVCLSVCPSQIIRCKSKIVFTKPRQIYYWRQCCGLVCLFVSWPVSPRMDLNKQQYDLGRPDRWEYPTYFSDIKAGLSWSTLEIYSWLIYAPPLLHAFVHFCLHILVVYTIVDHFCS